MAKPSSKSSPPPSAVPSQLSTPSTLHDLLPDPLNARVHGDRNKALIGKSVREIGPARSGVIDEQGVLLAGNGTAEVLKEEGFSKIKVIPTDGNEWVVVRRKNLTPLQKRALAFADNRAGELATWEPTKLAGQAMDLKQWFTDAELTKYNAVPTQLVGGGPDSEEPDTPDVPPGPTSAVRMVQLFLDTATQPEFLAMVSRLRGYFSTDNPTDTVLAALRYARHSLT